MRVPTLREAYLSEDEAYFRMPKANRELLMAEWDVLSPEEQEERLGLTKKLFRRADWSYEYASGQAYWRGKGSVDDAMTAIRSLPQEVIDRIWPEMAPKWWEDEAPRSYASAG